MTGLETIDPPLLDASEGAAVEVLNPAGLGRAVLVCEHAAHRIPAALGSLGLEAAARKSHVAWDPGAVDLARELAARLDAPLVAARFSRLVYDCNRPPESPAAMPDRSEIFDIPGNRGLTAAARRARVAALYEPFRRMLAGVLEARIAAHAVPAMVTVHSFTPVWFGRPRPVELGILHDVDARLADALLDRLASRSGLAVARNTPYGPEDGVTHTLKVQAIPLGLPNVMLEVRNDLLAAPDGVARIADLLMADLPAALDAVGAAAGAGAGAGAPGR